MIRKESFSSVSSYARKHRSEYKKYRKITKQRAIKLYNQRSRLYINAIRTGIRVPLTQYQFDALFSLAYNIGPGGFKRSLVAKALNRGQYHKVGSLMMRYVNSGGRPNAGLIKRRLNEAFLFNTGDYHYSAYRTNEMKRWCKFYNVKSRACGS